MSKLLITASGATVMLAVNWVEPLNVVELTVTPPGFVVPVTNHWALAPFWNPFPVIAMSRLIVSWGAVLGLAESTWIWAVAGSAFTPVNNARTTKNTDEQRLRLICTPREELVSGLAPRPRQISSSRTLHGQPICFSELNSLALPSQTRPSNRDRGSGRRSLVPRAAPEPMPQHPHSHASAGKIWS